MDLNEYQRKALETAIYPSDPLVLTGLVYTALGLNGEAGEVAEIIKKMIRDNTSLKDNQSRIAQELGDVLWYIANLGEEIGVSLETIAKANLIKLKDRKKRDALKGSGDNR